jgi:hypothetical protein
MSTVRNSPPTVAVLRRRIRFLRENASPRAVIPWDGGTLRVSDVIALDEAQIEIEEEHARCVARLENAIEAARICTGRMRVVDASIRRWARSVDPTGSDGGLARYVLNEAPPMPAAPRAKAKRRRGASQASLDGPPRPSHPSDYATRDTGPKE